MHWDLRLFFNFCGIGGKRDETRAQWTPHNFKTILSSTMLEFSARMAIFRMICVICIYGSGKGFKLKVHYTESFNDGRYVWFVN